MYATLFYPLRRIDWLLLLLVGAVLGVGLAALESAAPSDSVLARQLSYAQVGLLAMLVCACVGWRVWKWLSAPLYLLTVALLLAVALFGVEANNARRWLDLGLFTIQPSELAKVSVPLALACWYSLFRKRALWQHAVAVALAAAPVLLVFGQPDLGTAVMIAAIVLFVVFFAGLPWWLICSVSAAGALLAPLVWTSLLKDYQRERVLSVLDPYQDPLGAGYHNIQSSIAVGSGGMWGKGLGQGTQSQLGFLPEQHTDFIFAVYAEELGFVGCAGLLLLIFMVFAKTLTIAGRSRDEAGGLFAAGIAFAFLLQALINLGMVSGLLPVVGLPLPLISYGGTSLLTFMVAFGMLMAIAKHRDAKAPL